jgi:hypothetical protein
MKIETWKKRRGGIVVQAVLLTEDNATEVAGWCRGLLVEEKGREDPTDLWPGINVPTPNGHKRASLGMYVIKSGTKFFVATMNAFEQTYETLEIKQPVETPNKTRERLGFGDPYDGIGRI